MMTLPLPARLRSAYHRRRTTRWFLSFPKSGRTWTKTLVERYLSDLYGLPPFEFESFEPIVNLGKTRGVPRVYFHHPECRDTDGRPTRILMDRLADRHVILLFRDPREVVFTYYHRLRKRIGDPRVMAMDLAEFVRHPEYGIGRIVDFTNTWYRARTRFRSHLVLRFEDVREDPAGQVGRLLEFLEVPVKNDRLARIVAATPDATTRSIEDDSQEWTPADLDFIAEAVMELDPGLGYVSTERRA